MNTTIWESWIGDDDPIDFLVAADQQVAVGKYDSRRAVFFDFAEHALRALGPEGAEEWTPETLANALLSYAETREQGPSL